MGTRMQLSVLTADASQAIACSAALEATLLRQGIDWYAFTARPEGELKQLNAALHAGESMPVSASLLPLLQAAVLMFERSDGYFDPAIQPLTEAWGFARLADQSVETPTDILARWHTDRPTLAALRIMGDHMGNQVSSNRRDLQLDLGAIAKGYALQLASRQLSAQGCADHALNLGGQLALQGAMAEHYPAVRIRSPRGNAYLAELQLKAGESISTSGDYERFTLRGGQRQHHLLDPHTGMPVTHTQAVTVVSNDATLADAASTALMAAGPAHWQRIARHLGVAQVLRVDATGAVQVTAALYARLHWLDPATKDLVQIIEP